MAIIAENILVGKAAIRAGSQDFGDNELQTDLVDTLTNIMHAAKDEDLAFDEALDSARNHFATELFNRE